MMVKLKSITITWLSTALLVNADLPVHCLRNQIAGKWKFFLSPPTDTRRNCGHRTPDVEKMQPSLTDFSSSDASELEVMLTEPNVATVKEVNSGSESISLLQRISEKSGKWTMIYDEGFNVKTDALDLFGFNHFEIPESSMIHGKKFFRSYCGKTEIGWYRKKNTDTSESKYNYGCYRAERVDKKRDTVFFHLSLLAQSKATVAAGKHAFLSKENQNQYDGVEEELGFQDRYRLVDRLGNNDIVNRINADSTLGWKAEKYSNEFLAEKMWQLRRRALRQVGKRSSRDRSIDDETLSEDAMEETSESLNLPKNFDWSKQNGESFLDEILDQSDCGSCYAVATIHMLGARYRILKNDSSLLKPNAFSVNFPLYCSDLNQGCNGGYPSLVSMWSRDVGLVPHKCGGNYFTSSSATCKSAMPEDFKTCVELAGQNKEVAKVKDWNYIGGYYGACSAVKMMEDLYKYGPIAVALEPGPDFMYYKSGVYSSVSLSVDVNWVKVDHAVLLIGWGEENDKKYWTIQNSWGDSWGENGNIRLVRGENESGVEFQAVSAQLEDGKAGDILSYVKGVKI